MNEAVFRVIAEAATEWAQARQEFLVKTVTGPRDLDRLSLAEARLYALTGVSGSVPIKNSGFA